MFLLVVRKNKMNKLNLIILSSGLIFLSAIIVKFISFYIISNSDNVYTDASGDKHIILESRRINSKGDIISSWDSEKFETLKVKANKNDLEAQTTLGYLYLMGEFVVKDLSKSEAWLKIAGEQGSSLAQAYLGYLYAEKGNISEAIQWYRKSSAQNNADAQLNLALLLGDQNDFDVNEIVELLEMSIKNGNKESYFPLAWWYLNELSLNKEQEGLKLLGMAVDCEDKDAEYLLAELYETGDLVEQNLKKSKELYLRAKIHGSLEAFDKLKQDKFK